MHSAPAVSYPVGRSSFMAYLIGGILLVSVLVGVLWLWQEGSPGWRQWLYVVASLLAGIVAVVAWWRTERGVLRWDGEVWSWSAADVSVCGSLTVHLDLQFCMLISLHQQGRTRLWCCPERRSRASLWFGLRRAVFCKLRANRTSNVPSEDELVMVKL
jgi:toxin CptA